MFRRAFISGTEAVRRGMGLNVELENQSLSRKLQTAYGRPDLSREVAGSISQERVQKLLGREQKPYPH